MNKNDNLRCYLRPCYAGPYKTIVSQLMLGDNTLIKKVAALLLSTATCAL